KRGPSRTVPLAKLRCRVSELRKAVLPTREAPMSIIGIETNRRCQPWESARACGSSPEGVLMFLRASPPGAPIPFFQLVYNGPLRSRLISVFSADASLYRTNGSHCQASSRYDTKESWDAQWRRVASGDELICPHSFIKSSGVPLDNVSTCIANNCSELGPCSGI